MGFDSSLEEEGGFVGKSFQPQHEDGDQSNQRPWGFLIGLSDLVLNEEKRRGGNWWIEGLKE